MCVIWEFWAVVMFIFIATCALFKRTGILFSKYSRRWRHIQIWIGPKPLRHSPLSCLCYVHRKQIFNWQIRVITYILHITINFQKPMFHAHRSFVSLKYKTAMWIYFNSISSVVVGLSRSNTNSRTNVEIFYFDLGNIKTNSF